MRKGNIDHSHYYAYRNNAWVDASYYEMDTYPLSATAAVGTYSAGRVNTNLYYVKDSYGWRPATDFEKAGLGACTQTQRNNVKQSKAITLGDPTFPGPESNPVCYRVSTDANGKSWYDEMQDGKDTGGSSDDYAGSYGEPIRWLAVKDATYRVHTQDSGWLPWISGGYNIHDLEDGCAGDGSPINGVEIKNSDIRYAVHVVSGEWYSDMIGQKDTGGSGDTYAGDLSNSIDAIRIRRN